MCNRAKVIADFLAQSDWPDWEQSPLVNDASARRYIRLTKNGHSKILMDAPPENGEDTKPFAKLAKYLLECGLHPPSILAHDVSQGIMVLSDLGPDHFAGWLVQNPNDHRLLYKSAIEVLIKLQTCQPPQDLKKMTPQVGADMIKIAAECYASKTAPTLTREMQCALDTLAPDANTLALRDFHAENLIWRPQFDYSAQVGLLDFQDAFIAPAGYDLASLLRDVRRDIDPTFADQMIAYYLERTDTPDTFRAQLACLGAQRNLRILGVFARLATHMNKKRYVAFIPRVWTNLQRDLAHPALKRLKQAVNDTLPAPNGALMERLRK